MGRVRSVRLVLMGLAAVLFFGAACFSVSSAYGAVLDDRSQGDGLSKFLFQELPQTNEIKIINISNTVNSEDEKLQSEIQNIIDRFGDNFDEARKRLRNYGGGGEALLNYPDDVMDYLQSKGEDKPSRKSMRNNITLNTFVVMTEIYSKDTVYRFSVVDNFINSDVFKNLDQRRKSMIQYFHMRRKIETGRRFNREQRRTYYASRRIVESSYIFADHDEKMELLEYFLCRPIIRIRDRYLELYMC